MARDALIIIRRHAFATFLEAGLRRCGVLEGDRVLAAVSGGADSTALLIGLAAVASLNHWKLDLHIAHVQHHLRPDAEADAEFVRNLAERFGLRFHRRDIHPATEGQNLEAASRKLRYAALLDIAAEVDADSIATAHHAEDQLETVLMRLIRGASVRGLGGMAHRRRLGDRVLIRPMLDLSRDTGRALLAAAEQPWREDATNADVSRLRAALRTNVIPALTQISDSAVAKACDTADRLRETASLVDALIRAAERRHLKQLNDHTTQMDRTAARRMHRELLAGIIRHQCLAHGAAADRLGLSTMDQILSVARDARGDQREFTLSNNVKLTITAQHLTWSHP